jgi:hypothetical protein
VLAGQTTVVAEAELMEKAKSKAQQKAAGAALAAKRGEGTAKGASKEMTKMDTKELKKVAGTKHKGLPEKKTESIDEAKDDDKYVPPKKTEKETTLPSGAKVKTTVVKGGRSQKAEKDSELNWAKESVELDVEEFNETFSAMVEAAKEESDADAKKKREEKKKKIAKIVDEGAKPDFLDLDKDGDKKEPMKKAAADKKAGPKKGVNPFAKKDESVAEGKSPAQKAAQEKFKAMVGKKKPVKESVERKLTFKQMMSLVVESGGQQQIDPTDQALFAWAQRVAETKLGEGMKAEVYAGLVYERMGGRFEMYDVLSESAVKEGKDDAGSTIGKAIINKLKQFKELGNHDFSRQELQQILNVAKVYINKGERAGLRAQMNSGMGDAIDELMPDTAASHRTTWSEASVVNTQPVMINGKQVDLNSVDFSIYGRGTDEYDITDARFVDGTPLSDREIQQLYSDDTIIDMHREELMQMSMGGNPHLR